MLALAESRRENCVIHSSRSNVSGSSDSARTESFLSSQSDVQQPKVRGAAAARRYKHEPGVVGRERALVERRIVRQLFHAGSVGMYAI